MGNSELLISVKGGKFAISGRTMFKNTSDGEKVYLRINRAVDSSGRRNSKDIPTDISANSRGRVKELRALLNLNIGRLDAEWEKEISAPRHFKKIDCSSTLIQYLNDFTDNLMLGENGIAPTTHLGYKGNIDRFEKYLEMQGLNGLLLTNTQPQHLSDFINWLKSQGLTVRTIKRYMNSIRPALRQAENFEQIEKNPFAKVDTKKMLRRASAEENSGECFTKVEMDEFFKVAHDEQSPLERIFKVTFLLGLRRSEVLGLRWDHIDFDNKTIIICGNVQKIGGELKIDLNRNKTVKSKSTFSMSNDLFDLLQFINH